MTNTNEKMFSYFFTECNVYWWQSIWCKPEGWLDGLVDGGRGNKINYYYYWCSYQLLQLCFCMPDHLFTIVTRFSCWGSHGKKNCFCLSYLAMYVAIWWWMEKRKLYKHSSSTASSGWPKHLGPPRKHNTFTSHFLMTIIWLRKAGPFHLLFVIIL